MLARKANAEWKGDLKSGGGTVRTQTGAVDGQYSFKSRFEQGTGTNPEELVAAAHAGCYSMALSNMLAEAGHAPDSVKTTATVNLEFTDDGPAITRIDLVCRARVPGIDASVFAAKAADAKAGCPISKALAAVEITMDAELED